MAKACVPFSIQIIRLAQLVLVGIVRVECVCACVRVYVCVCVCDYVCVCMCVARE